MRTFLLLVLAMLLGTGISCARVSVQGPKDPIKLDISMRLDVYQHVAKDVDDIESMVSGEPAKSKGKGDQSFLNVFVTEAYAAEGLSPEVQEAVSSRKERRSKLVALETQGIIGENKSGLVEVRDSSKAGAAVEDMVSSENNDRMVIYKSIAAKNGTDISEVQGIYAKRLQDDAEAGTPIQGKDGAWKIKS